MNSLADIWQCVMDSLAATLTPTALNTWFAECTPVAIENNRLIIHTPTDFKRGIIQSRFAETITNILSDIFSAQFELVILAGDEEKAGFEEELAARGSLPEVAGFTFENFVVGPSNKYAHAAAKAVSEKPGTVYNPLFIYGNSGLGKTHLLLAIGQAIHETSPQLNIVYVKGEAFTNDLVRAIREGTTDDFREKYRSVDLLLMDDIQFIAGKAQTQEEFFHTFNALYEEGKQIVVTSDRPPMEMSRLEDRIRTRLEWGLMADVQPPDMETRMAITRNKAAQLGMVLSDDVVEFISERITSNIRQLEGVVKKLTAYKSLLNDEIDVTTAKRAIQDVIHMGPYVPTPETIMDETSRYYGIAKETILGLSRQKKAVTARQVAMYLCRALTSLPLQDIGNEFNRDHSTVLVSIRKVEDQLRSSNEISAAVRDITSNINSKE